jgi:RimJ/RimL family protein N-acetyltransferase
VSPLVLRGPTVTLQPLTEADAVALADAAAECRDEYAWTRVPIDLEDARRYIETGLAEHQAGRQLPFTIVWQGRAVGSTSFLDLQHWRWPAGSPHRRAAEPDVVEIGATWLAASAQRTRCNTEAKHLMLLKEPWRAELP